MAPSVGLQIRTLSSVSPVCFRLTFSSCLHLNCPRELWNIDFPFPLPHLFLCVPRAQIPALISQPTEYQQQCRQVVSYTGSLALLDLSVLWVCHTDTETHMYTESYTQIHVHIQRCTDIDTHECHTEKQRHRCNIETQTHTDLIYCPMVRFNCFPTSNSGEKFQQA